MGENVKVKMRRNAEICMVLWLDFFATNFANGSPCRIWFVCFGKLIFLLNK